MSIFNENTVKQSNSWAEDRLYTRSAQMCPHSWTHPAWIERKSDKKTYHTVYSLYVEYCDMCEFRYPKEMFIDIVKKECTNKVIYKGETYYSWWWFYNNFVDIDKDLKEFW